MNLAYMTTTTTLQIQEHHQYSDYVYFLPIYLQNHHVLFLVVFFFLLLIFFFFFVLRIYWYFPALLSADNVGIHCKHADVHVKRFFTKRIQTVWTHVFFAIMYFTSHQSRKIMNTSIMKLVVPIGKHQKIYVIR